LYCGVPSVAFIVTGWLMALGIVSVRVNVCPKPSRFTVYVMVHAGALPMAAKRV